MIGYLGLAAAICGSDLMIKETVKEKVAENSKTYICNNKMILTKFFNHGAALGALGKKPELLKTVTVFGIGSLVGALAGIDGMKKQVPQKLGLSMMLGGALSNAFERFVFGKVTDYIQFNVKNPKYRKIVYNFGDFAIFAGSILLIFAELFHGER